MIFNGNDGNAAGKKSISILINNGLDQSTNQNTTAQMEQLCTFIKQDIQKRLRSLGDVTFITDKKDFTADGKDFLLIYNILNYNPGSSAARIMVGFGAGACSMDIEYELIGSDKKSITTNKDGCGSGRGWRAVVEKLDKQLVQHISGFLK